MANGTRNLADLEQVVDDEIEIVSKRRHRLYGDNITDCCTQTTLVGLALSGGGIRSAVTNLGVLYEMSRVGLFNVVDYLSTVSGGGYIGCCVASLLSLKKPESGSVEQDESCYTYKGIDESLFSADWNSFPFRDLPFPEKKRDTPEASVGNVRETTAESNFGVDRAFCKEFSSRDQVFHLRNRVSYLVPSSLPFGSYVTRALGAVSASTLLALLWFFSLVVLVTTLYMLLAFPAWSPDNPAAHPGSVSIAKIHNANNGVGAVLSEINGTSVTEGIFKKATVALKNVAGRLSFQVAAFSDFPSNKWYFFLFGTVWGIIAPSCMHWLGSGGKTERIIGEDFESYIARKQMKFISLTTVFLLFIVYGMGFIVIQEVVPHPDPRLILPLFFAAGCLVGSLVMLCLLTTDIPVSGNRQHGEKRSGRLQSYLSWNRISRSEVALCTGIFIYCLVGSCIFAFLPAFILSGNSGFLAMTLALVILILRSYFSGEKKRPAGEKEKGLKVVLDKVGRWLLGILVPATVLLAVIGAASSLGSVFFGPEWPESVGPVDSVKLGIVFFISASLVYIFSRLNFNNISPHVFYKDRLAEAFLLTLMRSGENDGKKGDYATWMELARNAVELSLLDLHGNDEHGNCAARGPYLLINTTLNLTAARDVQGYQRQSENFLFSRCYTGSNRTGYLMTSAYNPPLKLGRAMTISGAAVTSVMGAKGSLAESFACTILGVRLGYWLRNPVDMAKDGNPRKWNWKNLYFELFRYTDSRHSHVYLSDGGHCGDNLGLLALLQRKTKLIIASDAECDPDHLFDSLNNSIRRAYVDHNIKVHISLDDLMPDKNGFTKKHFVIGRIIYPDRPWQKSWLLVIKNTITGRENPPILNYRKKSPAFPHETTADQFFTEEQFEVYRSLGREACMEIWNVNIDIFRSREWLRNPWACIDTFCWELAGKDYRWDDVIRAIWSSEKGDFSNWDGFMKTVGEYVRELVEPACNDDSVMVTQLHELDKWLSRKKHLFPLLQGKYDIPRSWRQFMDIRKLVAMTMEK